MSCPGLPEEPTRTRTGRNLGERQNVGRRGSKATKCKMYRRIKVASVVGWQRHGGTEKGPVGTQSTHNTKGQTQKKKRKEPKGGGGRQGTNQRNQKYGREGQVGREERCAGGRKCVCAVRCCLSVCVPRV